MSTMVAVTIIIITIKEVLQFCHIEYESVCVRAEAKATIAWSHEAIFVKITIHLNSLIKLRERKLPKMTQLSKQRRTDYRQYNSADHTT